MAIRDVIKTVGARTITSVRNHFYDARHRADAMQFIRNVEQHTGRRLTKAMRREADDYAKAVFGSTRFAPWLYVYTLIHGRFREGWIPDNYLGRVVMPAANGPLRFIGDYKTFSNIALKTDLLPDIACFIEGHLYDRTMSPIDARQIRDLLPAGKNNVFVKQDDSSRGIGVHHMSCDALNDEFFHSVGNCAIQAPVEQHPYFDEFTSASVATVRINTVRELDGSFAHRAPYLRLGYGDTAWILGNNSLQISILSEDGDLDPIGYDTHDFHSCTAHPDTGVPFENKRVPKFTEVAAACVDLHSKMPHFGMIGWDVTIDRDEKVKIFEWNTDHPGIKLAESTMGPCFTGLGWEKLKDVPLAPTL
jgi:Sugar-transfer associated ATP-grasp